MKLKCKCGRVATWLYMPNESHYCCDDCVPRGCTCWIESIECEDGSLYYPQGIEGKDWKWIEENQLWEKLDGEGKQMPCCEWWYDEEGWDNEA